MMKKNTSLISLFVALMLAVTQFTSPAAIPSGFMEDITMLPIETTVEATPAPENDGSVSGYIPSPVQMHAAAPLTDTSSSRFYLAGDPTPPPSYDLRTYDSKNYVSPVKDQGNNGVCWAFANNSSLESHLLKKYNPLATNTYDYSEAHMSYDLSKYTNSGALNPWGFDRIVTSGGNIYMSMAHYARGSGPVLESNDLYPLYPNYLTNRALSITNAKPVDMYVSDMYIIPNIVDRDAITNAYIAPTQADILAHHTKVKQMLMTYGAVNTAFYNDEFTYYNTGRTAYYYPRSSSAYAPNHAVSIIGWDDNYSKTNFKSGVQPPENGAFLIKNSWGSYNTSGWGSNTANYGYFWMSYYDNYAAYDAGCIAKTKDTRYDNIHQYDPFGVIGEFWQGVPFSVIASQYDCQPGEILKAIGFDTIMENIYYEIYINPSSGNSTSDFDFFFDEGVPPTTSGTLPYAGHHTIPLPSPMTLTGNDFSVIIYFETNNGSGGTVMHTPYEKNALQSNGQPYLSQATSNPAECYFYTQNPVWTDAKTQFDASFCIKALTDNPPVTDNFEYTISYANGQSAPLQTITAGTVKTKFDVTNTTAATRHLSGVAALYKDNILRNVKVANLADLSGSSASKWAEVSFDVPEGGGYSIKGMILDKNNMPVPVIKTTSILDNAWAVTNRHYAKDTVTLQAGKQSSVNLLGSAGGVNCDLTHRYTWTSGNTSIATVTPNGRITGVSVGETYIKSNDDTMPKMKVIVTN